MKRCRQPLAVSRRANWLVGFVLKLRNRQCFHNAASSQPDSPAWIAEVHPTPREFELFHPRTLTQAPKSVLCTFPRRVISALLRRYPPQFAVRCRGVSKNNFLGLLRSHFVSGQMPLVGLVPIKISSCSFIYAPKYRPRDGLLSRSVNCIYSVCCFLPCQDTPRLIESSSAPSIRVCQPGPVALKCSITSGEKRSETSFFVGAFCGPRLPRRTILPLRVRSAW